jgi:hypothetical protein
MDQENDFCELRHARSAKIVPEAPIKPMIKLAIW